MGERVVGGVLMGGVLMGGMRSLTLTPSAI